MGRGQNKRSGSQSSGGKDQAPLVEGLGRDYKGTLPEEIFCSGFRECLQCMVCQKVPLKPLRCPGSCGQIWCQPCAEEWLGKHSKKTCPTCQDQVSGVGSLRTGWGVAFGELVGMATIRCPFTPSGCKTTGNFDSMISHVDPPGKEGCGFRMVNCGLGNCAERVHLKDLSSHRGKCPHRTVECRDCHEKMPSHALQPHGNRDCLQKVVGCPLKCEGGGPLKRGEVEGHEKLCPLVKVTCPLCPSRVERGQVHDHLSADSSHIPSLLALVEDLKRTVQHQAEAMKKMESTIGECQSRIASQDKDIKRLEHASPQSQGGQGHLPRSASQYDSRPMRYIPTYGNSYGPKRET